MKTPSQKTEGRRKEPAGRSVFSALLPPSFFVCDLGLGISCLLLYTLTLSPSLLPADAGEYQVVGAVLGVAHPPGFALYTLLNWLIARALFFIPPATAINFLSALFAALALVLLSRTVRALTHSGFAGVCAALALGFSTTFWAQAVTANVRMPATLAIALALERLAAYRFTLSKRPERNEVKSADAPPSSTTPLRGFAQSAGASTSDTHIQRTLALFALALGLGVSHHGSVVFVAALLGLYALWLDPQGLLRAGAWPLLLGLLPFLFWLYFPLRASAFGAPSGIATLDGFLEHVLARGFQGDILQITDLKQLPDRLLVLGNILTFEFTWPLLLLTALGTAAVLRKDRPFGFVLLLALVAHTLISISYKSPQTVEYLLPAYLLMAVLMGFAFAELFSFTAKIAESAEKFASRQSPAASRHLPFRHAKRSFFIFHSSFLIIALLFLLQFLSTFPSYRALARDTATRDYAESVLSAAPVNAVILASWHWSTPLWYLQQVEGRRPDVEVRYVYPRTASLAQDWVGEINAALPARPVVITSFYKQEFDALGYRFIPLGPAWEVRAEPLVIPPHFGFRDGRVFDHWAFVGYVPESPDALAPGETLTLLTAWQTAEEPVDVNFFVHLIGSDGRLYGQMDVSHPAARYVSGEILVDRYRVMPYLNTPPGKYMLTAGAYLPDGTRLAEANLATITITSLQLPVSHPPDAVPLGASILLTGFEIHPSGPVRPGEAVTVDLHFLAARPIVEDDAVKVDLIGPNYAWRVQSDGTPAVGAIPTLKWIAGSRIADRRVLTIPADAAPGTAQLVLAMYDSFTQQDLPILDPALAALGPTVPLGTIDIIQP
jgi:hypothetical protein